VDAILVEARRGGVVEAWHRVHAVAVQGGAVVAEAGDSGLVCFLRSSSKPLQALSLVRAREDVDDVDVAIASASHRAEPAQVEAVRRLLAKAPADASELECGTQEGRPPEPVCHNCSGKHAGMLATCRARGWASAGYRLADHPLQRELHEVHAEAAGVAAAEIPAAIDGCGVQTFALPLERMAHAFSRLAALEGGDRVAAAMRAHPELVGASRGAPDTDLMRALPGWIAKSGAEGLLCAASPDGIGVAVKTEDGSHRAHRPALAAFLGLLGLELPDFAVVTLANGRGDRIGELAAAP
jgi:L-asparaginase II